MCQPVLVLPHLTQLLAHCWYLELIVRNCYFQGLLQFLDWKSYGRYICLISDFFRQLIFYWHLAQTNYVWVQITA